MPNDNKDQESKESSLHAELQKKQDAKLHREKMRRVLEEVENAVRGKQISGKKGVDKAHRKSAKAYQEFMEMRSRKSSNDSLQVGTFFSWMMDSVPEFKALVKSIMYKGHAYRKQSIGDPVSIFIVKNLASGYYSYLAPPHLDEDFQLPDIKYILDVDSDGKLNIEMLHDSFGSLFDDDNGNYSEENAKEVYQILNGYMYEWIESLDGLGPEDQGYFIALEGNPPKPTVYPKAYGEFVEGNWEVKEGCENQFVTADKMMDIAEGCGYPDKSFAAFLKNKCPDVNLEQVDSPRPRM